MRGSMNLYLLCTGMKRQEALLKKKKISYQSRIFCNKSATVVSATTCQLFVC